jgi:hypothetical protein
MNITDELQVIQPDASCAVDRSCAENRGCGCGPTSSAATGSAARANLASKTGSGIKAAIVGFLCVLGCLAGPLLIGGVAAASSALAGEAWILSIGVVAAIIIGVVLKKRGKGSIC